MKMKYLHTMVRVKDLDASMRFYELLGAEGGAADRQRQGAVHAGVHGAGGAGGRAGRADAQLGRRRGAAVGQPALRASRLRGRGHLRQVRGAAGGGGDDQPAAARRAHGVRALARTTCRWSCCRSASGCRRRSRGRAWRTPALGEAALASRGAGRGRAGGGGLPAGAVARARRVVVGRRARVPAADRGAGRGADGARGAGGVPGDAGAAGDAARLRVVAAGSSRCERLPGRRSRGRTTSRGWRGARRRRGGASSSIRRRSATRCSSAGGRSATRGDCERRTLDVSGDGTNNDGIAPELARRDVGARRGDGQRARHRRQRRDARALLPAVRDPGAGGLRRGGRRTTPTSSGRCGASCCASSG